MFPRLRRRRLLAQRRGQSGRDFLKSVAAEIALGRKTRQGSGQRELVRNLWQRADLEREVLRRLRAHGVVELAQAAKLLDDGLLLVAPDNFVLS